MGQIDLQQAKDMVSNYASTRKKLIDGTYGINDTISIWFSSEEVKAFTDSLTAETSGVRIYLGAYDAKYPSTPDQTTVIAIGTVKDSSGNDVDAIGGVLDKGAVTPPAYNSGKLCPPFCP